MKALLENLIIKITENGQNYMLVRNVTGIATEILKSKSVTLMNIQDIYATIIRISNTALSTLTQLLLATQDTSDGTAYIFISDAVELIFELAEKTKSIKGASCISNEVFASFNKTLFSLLQFNYGYEGIINWTDNKGTADFNKMKFVLLRFFTINAYLISDETPEFQVLSVDLIKLLINELQESAKKLDYLVLSNSINHYYRQTVYKAIICLRKYLCHDYVVRQYFRDIKGIVSLCVMPFLLISEDKRDKVEEDSETFVFELKQLVHNYVYF